MSDLNDNEEEKPTEEELLSYHADIEHDRRKDDRLEKERDSGTI